MFWGGICVTQQQKNAIQRLRRDGMGYSEIAKRLNLSVNTVKSFGRRCPSPTGSQGCMLCGQPLTQTPGRKPKRFCSDKCRLKWWNQNPAASSSATLTTCLGCGLAFMALPGQKYCSHQCYIRTRFGGGRREHAI